MQQPAAADRPVLAHHVILGVLSMHVRGHRHADAEAVRHVLPAVTRAQTVLTYVGAEVSNA